MLNSAYISPLMLIVTNDSATAQVLCQLAEHDGYAWERATTGAETLDACQRLHPQFVLSECILPDMDCIDLCKTLKTLADSANTLLILIADSALDTQFIDRAIEAGIVDCLEKPFDLQWRWFSQRAQYLTRTQGAEEALQQERKQWQAVIDNVPDFIYVKDTESHFVRANIATAIKMGVATSAELIGKSDFDFQPHELAAHYFASERKLIDSGTPLINLEEPLLDRQTGNIAHYLSTKVPLRDGQGKTIGLVGVSRNITERKREEEILERERTLLRTVIDYLPDYIFAKDADGRFLISNLAHARAANLDPEAVVGKLASDIFPAHMAAQFDADDEAILTSGQALINAERRTVDPTGAEREVLTTKVPLTNSHGRVVGLVGISRDVTEYKLTVEALRQNEERYRLISEMISDYAYSNRIEPDGLLVTEWETGSMSSSIGYASVEMLDLQQSQRYGLFHPDDRVQASADMAKLLTGQPVDNDYRIVAKSGETRWIHLHRFPVWDDSQQRVIRYYGVIQDITTYKQMEDKLAVERNLLRTVIDAIPDQIFIKDTQGRFVMTNRAVVEVMGLADVNDLIGYRDADFLPAHLAEGYLADDQQVIQSGQALINREEFTVDQTGAPGWLLTTKVPWRDSRGSVIGIIGVGRNITERKRIDQALQDSEVRFRAIFEKAAIGIALVDKTGYPFESNGALQRMLGYSQEELRRLTFKQFTYPDDLESELQLTEELLAGKREYYETERRYIHKKGNVVCVHLTVSLVRDSALQPQFAIGMIQDITERKHSEQQALELTIAHQKVHALRTFIQDASHDLNTPITALITGSYICRKLAEQTIKQTIAAGNQSSSGQLTITNEIGQTAMKLYEQSVSQEKAALRLRKTVADLIKITQLDQRPTLNLELHDLFATTSIVVDLCSPLAADKNISLHLERDLDLPFVVIDEDELTQAIQNIIQNAITYTPAGGSITVRIQKHAQEVSVAVTDTGLGIDKADLSHIFERFYRADLARSTSTGGSGLGLAITKNIIDAHKGRIEVNSELGKGSTFTIYLPTDSN